MLALALAAVLGATSLDGAQQALSEGLDGGRRSFYASFSAPELASATEGEQVSAHLGVHLPIRYALCRSGVEACWLLIYLPGFDSSAESSLALLDPLLDALEAEGETPPVVAVVLDGRNHLGGGWYADSAHSGHWRSLLSGAVIPAAGKVLLRAPVERTIVVGHSMGGFGALNLAEETALVHGAGALNPILRPEHLAEYCLRAAKEPELADGGELSKSGSGPRLPSGSFCARLLLSMHDAFFAGRVVTETAALEARWEPDAGWLPNPDLAAGLEAQDLIRADRLQKVTRLFAATGARDPLSPPADLEALQDALGEGTFSSSMTRVTPGDHTSDLRAELRDAVRYLTATASKGGAAPP